MARQARNAVFDLHQFLNTVNSDRVRRSCRKGESIYLQGAAADAVYYIQQGRVKISVTSEQGKEAVVALLGTGEFFGEGCLIAQPLRFESATALVESVVLRVTKAHMARLLRTEPAFVEMFMAHLLTRKSRAEEDLVDQMFNSSEKRLARTLLLLANFGKTGKTEPITPKISQETLAEMIGTTRPRISFFLNKFRKLGLIEYNGDLKVHSSLLSVVLRE